MDRRQPALEELVTAAMAATASFWSGKSVFLTGHTGFKGSWLGFWLSAMGARVTGYALEPPTTPSLFEAAALRDRLHRSEIADIRDRDRLEAALSAARPDIVIHMAAQPLVLRSYRDPVETYATNVMGTVHLLDAVRRSDSVRVVVNVTSDKCYENREWVWGYRENEPMGGRDPYSNSKGCAELVTAAFRQSFFPPGESPVALVSGRAGNVVGGGDWAEDRLVPDLIRAFLDGRPAVVRNRHSTRPWQHVLDPLHGYLMLAEAAWTEPATHAEGWNFGPAEGSARPVHWVADRLASLWGDGAAWIDNSGPAGPHENRFLALDCAKARQRLGWAPRWDLAETLARTVEWYRAYGRGQDIPALMSAQLLAYNEARPAA